MGTNRIDPETVISYSNLKAGDKIEPDKLDGALKTLFKILAFEPGWLKWTDASLPTLKLCQFTIAWFEDWLTFNLSKAA